MKNCLKRKSVSLIIVVLLFAIILIPQGVAMARGYIDTSKKCSLKVNISEEWADLKSIDFSVKLYKVADVNQNCLFTPTKAQIRDIVLSKCPVSAQNITVVEVK